MRLFVANTDVDWYRHLSRLAAAPGGLDEVNFWQPSGGGAFRALRPGQPFLFKLHHPENFIVGGGFFAHVQLTVPEWASATPWLDALRDSRLAP